MPTSSVTRPDRDRARPWILLPFLAALLAACAGCATITDLAQVRRPTVAVNQVQFKDADFSAVDLLFDLAVDNPNAVPISLAGIDYGLTVGGKQLVSGSKQDALRIDSQSTGTVALPLRLEWASLAEAFQDVRARDSIDYTMDSALSFNLPVLGPVTVPVSKSGQLPVVKAPGVKIAGLQRKSVTLSGADLALLLDVENPNAFQLALGQLRYGFKVNGETWASGSHPTGLKVPAAGSGRIAIPMTLNFIEMGRAAFAMVSGNQPLQYQFDGDTIVETSLPMLKQIPWSMARSGEISVSSD